MPLASTISCDALPNAFKLFQPDIITPHSLKPAAKHARINMKRKAFFMFILTPPYGTNEQYKNNPLRIIFPT